MKILTIVGARPQFIKAAVVSRAIAKHNASNLPKIDERILHTGQHYDEGMSEVFFTELAIPKPALNLGVGSGSHGQQTAAMLKGIEKQIHQWSPDWVLLYGDTNSTLAGALAASKLHVPIAHVEAGLRSFNMRMPEEINRVLTDRIATRLYCPTEIAAKQLRQEGYPDEAIHQVGDVMYDAALFYGSLAEQDPWSRKESAAPEVPFILATIHRAENTDNTLRLAAIVDGLCLLSQEHTIVLPLHPRTKAALETYDKLKLLQNLKNLELIEPVGFLEMIQLERQAKAILTDSGGLQKEAYFHRTPCVTLREETEWRETIEMGWNRLVKPLNAAAIVQSVKDALESTPPSGCFPYGNGQAGEAIVANLIK